MSSYDEMPYRSVPINRTHPDHLAALARLYGLAPPPVDACCVLELGCADGSNLLPMAVAFPGSKFVGVDASKRQIASGRHVVDALGLANVTLLAQDVLRVDDGLGTFDYIIAYGIFSWVATPVQEHILRLCARHLAPAGVALISYNTYPGWHSRGLVRDMLRYHVARTAPAAPAGGLSENVAAARTFLRFLATAAQEMHDRPFRGLHFDAYAAILDGERHLLDGEPDSYVAHEFLEEANAPLYFHEFVERAERHGLQYLAEAEYAAMQFAHLPAPVADALRGLSRTRIEAEQYLDFVRHRSFRQTLLCHAAATLQPSPAAVASLAVASPAQPLSTAPDLRPGAEERFRGPSGTVVAVADPTGKAALLELHAAWPQAVPFADLWRRARARVAGGGDSAEPSASADVTDTPLAAAAWAPATPEPIRPPSDRADALPTMAVPTMADGTDAAALGALVLRCYGLDLVELHAATLPFTREVGERPVACPLARYQARRGLPIANRRHEVVPLDDATARYVLGLADGSRDRAALLAALVQAAGDATAGQAPTMPGHRSAAKALDGALQRLAGAALLAG